MATRGTKTTLIAGALGLAVLAGAVALFWDDVVIEWHVRRLHSEDDATRVSATKALAWFGAPVMPRLLRELRRCESERSPSEDHDSARDATLWNADGWDIQSAPSARDEGLPFDLGLVDFAWTLGSPALLPLILRLDEASTRELIVLMQAIEVALDPTRIQVLPDGTKVYVIATSFRSPPLHRSVRPPTAADPRLDCLVEIANDAARPSEVRLAAAEMFEKLKAKQAAVGAN